MKFIYRSTAKKLRITIKIDRKFYLYYPLLYSSPRPMHQNFHDRHLLIAIIPLIDNIHSFYSKGSKDQSSGFKMRPS